MRTTLTLMLTILATFCQGECPIECYCDQVRTCTGDKLLTRFPKIYTSSLEQLDSPSEIYPTRLELHEYGVTFLSGKDFLEIISNLTELSLTRNSLEEIENDTFSLSPLYTSRPSLSTTSGSEERHFLSAHLSSSSILTPPGGLPSGDSRVLKLRILDLSQNKLSYFVGGPKLKKLKILDLSSNKLQQVYEFASMEGLESVNLRDNRISYLEPTTFQNLRHLQYVNLDSNALGAIDPSTFSNLPALGHLILSSNPVSNLLPGFYWNSRVQFVDVSHVGLTSIPTSLTKTVRDFRCANNNLTIIRQTDFESYPNVGLLVLDENAIETVEDDAFGRLEFLSRLWMNGNRLTRIPQNLPPFLQSLHLEDNRILNLSASDFKNLRNLQELNLHGNRISSLPPYVFADLISLKNLDLRFNDIDVIYRDSFANLSKLQTLDVSQNPIKVIVTGAFGNLQKLSLLHLSRLIEAIEFDTTSFSPLHKLQILELDDSPHFAQKLIQESGLSHFPNLIELNLQRCELQDLNLVSNALSELNLQAVKMNGNPWDCQDLFGSAIHELMRRRTVVDEPMCDQPLSLKGVKVSSVNSTVLSLLTTQPPPSFQIFDLDENSSEEIPLDFTELTPEEQNNSGNSPSLSGQSFASSLDKVTSAPNTNSPENVPHAPNATTVSGGPNTQNQPFQTGLGTKNVSSSSNPISNFSSPSNSSNKSSEKATVVPIGVLHQSMIGAPDSRGSTKSRPKDAPKRGVVDTITRKTPSDNNITSESSRKSGGSDSDKIINSGNSDNLDTDAVPTRSYFDYSWKSSISLSSKDGEEGSVGGDKKHEISIPIQRPRTETVDKTKTNDDNTIIDESLRRGSSGLNDGEETGPKTIDGFPARRLEEDRVAKASPSISNSLGNGKNRRPEAFYLRREYQTDSNANNQPYESTGKAIIVKTLIISAATCLASILILLSISYGVYRFAKRRSGIFYCNSGSRNSGEGESGGSSSTSSSTRMSYTRFGRKKDGRNRRRDPYTPNHGHNRNQHPKDFDSEDSDQVELSGITNRLYLENEDIYHIT